MPRFKQSDILFIFNPNSGKGNYQSVLAKLKKLAPKVDFEVCDSSGELDAAFVEYLPKKSVFVIVGGDGSVHEAAKHLLEKKDKYLAVYPNGSGNGFARELGFLPSVDKLLKSIEVGNSRMLDVLDLNGHTCVNVAGFGIDGSVSHAFAKASSRGLWQYIKLTLKTFLGFKPVDIKLEIDGKMVSEKLLMLTMANTRQFGNNAIIAPEANPADGKLNVTLLKPFPIYLLPLLVLRLFTGSLKQNKYIRFLESSSIISVDAPNADLHIDGEPRWIEEPIQISVKKQVLKVIIM
jgi:diacylglycerol kinase (ATP)